ncbi:MAG: tetratricopeptide repeat protein [Nitrospira sp.]|nr:tetratricopeptide repeat protein [Candidatus Manganitrophaceae bacterium]HIL34282.1 tetratricopeptide repeat protein [Candidatus Manganitrophaceae bacterium]
MSIIHDALKKAAAEKEAPFSLPSSLKYHSEKSTGLTGAKGVTLFLLFAFFLSAAYYFYEREGRLLLTDQAISPLPPPPVKELTPPKEISPVKESAPESISVPNKDQGQLILSEGLKRYHQGEYDHAARLFSEAIAIPSLSVLAHNNLGLTLRRMGKVDEAINHYKEAIRLDPNYAEAHNNLGMAHDAKGSIDQAGKHYKIAIDLKTSTPAFHLNHATWLERKGSFGDARREYQSFLRLSSDGIGSGIKPGQHRETLNLVKARLEALKGSLP